MERKIAQGIYPGRFKTEIVHPGFDTCQILTSLPAGRHAEENQEKKAKVPKVVQGEYHTKTEVSSKKWACMIIT